MVKAVDAMPARQNTMNIRRSLKLAVDAWPEPVLFAVQEFALFETQRLQASAAGDSGAAALQADIEKSRAAFKRLQKYFGTVHLEKDYKEELMESIDERYGRTS
ncbi:MAG: hypothetical protein LBT11_01710 [Treponema sp.]|jgi:hypothetical protein|nr:hypothetical protein [Treponema sp.]